MLYVMQLQHDKYYVGYSARMHNERLLQHTQNQGSLWTRKYKPIEAIYVDQEGQREDENQLTLEVMREYGWYNCRGGSWCQVDLKYPPAELASSKGLSKFRRASCKRSRVEMTHEQVKRKRSGCSRCGRASHTEAACYAKTDILGNNIEGESASEAEDAGFETGCQRCGRESHMADDCYARRDVNGCNIEDIASSDIDSEEEGAF